jgi:hypothetical protein
MNAETSDELSGTGDLTVQIIKPDGTTGGQSVMFGSGGPHSHFEGAFTIGGGPFSPQPTPGAYSFRLAVHDNAGNEAVYGPAELDALGFPSHITYTG